MDPITHTMTGAVLARAGGDRLTPLAPATLMLAANAPDIDIYTVWTESSFGSIAFRRGWTHGPVFLALLPIVVTLLVWLWDVAVRRRRDPSKPPIRLRWTFALALVGTLSHPLLDWLNTYGVRVLMPFNKTWFAGDSVFIIDPYWWALLGLTLLLARARRPIGAVRFAAVIAFLYPAVLVAVSAAGDRLALVEAERIGLGNVREILYQPRPANPLAAQLIAVTSEAYHIGALSWVGKPRVRFGDTTIARGPWNDPLVRRATEDQDVRDYLVWARYAWVRLDSANGAPVSVTFGDARFPERGFAGGLSGLRVPLVETSGAP